MFAVARNQSGGAWKFVGAAAVAIVGGIAIGYFVGDTHSPRTGEPVPQVVAPVVSTPAPSVAPPVQHLRPTNGDYTAPGAPRIAIREESTPILHRVTQTPPAAPDPEATQEVAPPPAPSIPHSSGANGTHPNGADSGSTGSAPTPPASAGNTGTPAPDKTAGDSSPTPPAPADPDFERVGKPSDSESGQESGGKAQFRVQTGSYTDESDARSIADELRGKGYTTSTRSEREGDHLIYKVQVGAYRTKTGAGKAADDLQKKGYPAYVSPIGP